MAKKQKQGGNPNIVKLWPTIVLAKRFAHYQKVNPALLELFYQHRERESRSPQQAYASRDDLLSQYPLHQELNELAEFISQGIVETQVRQYARGAEENVFLRALASFCQALTLLHLWSRWRPRTPRE